MTAIQADNSMIDFFIINTMPQTIPIQFQLLIGVALCCVIACIVLVIYFKKRKRL
ncbi:MAG: hypothetical protein ACFE8O_01300 [Candidatus Hermodarchaeota archaeon]